MNKLSRPSRRPKRLTSREAMPETITIESPERDVNPFVLIHSLLRGRYAWAFTLGLLGAAIGAWLCFHAAPVRYKSDGLIRIRPTGQKILYDDPSNSVIPMFQSYLDAQASLILSEQIVSIAMRDANWQAAGQGSSAADMEAFLARLDAKHFKGSELIQVLFTDENPQIAAAGVAATISAYETFAGSKSEEAGLRALTILQEREATLSAELETARREIEAFSVANGIPVEQSVSLKVQEVNELKAELRRAQIALASVGGTDENGQPTTQPAGGNAAENSADIIASSTFAGTDDIMRRYLAQRRDAARRLELERVTLGSDHPNIRAQRAAIKLLDEDIARYAQSLSQSQDLKAAAAASHGTADVYVPGSLPRLQAREATLRSYYEKALAELQEVSSKLADVTARRSELSGLKNKLAETRQRIEQIKLESTGGDRLEIISRGNVPTAPDGDKRAVLAAAGGLGGMSAGIGIILLVGLFDQKFRNLVDARATFSPRYRLLGAVPLMNEDGVTTEQAQASANCVYRIRSRLQMRLNMGERVFAITSAAPGNGKTTLTAALGLAFAACNSKTLLIDFDIIGGGLTSRANATARPKIGQVLYRQGAISVSQLEQGLERQRDTGGLLVETLIEMGYLKESDGRRALATQRQTMLGLFDVLAGESLADCVVATQTPNLAILPLGASGANHAARLSPPAINRLLQEAREEYDVVLIDTGPVLGSVEASVVGAAADGVIVTVSRGGQRLQVQQAFKELEEVDAPILGVVFNRATDKDLSSSGFSFSPSIRSMADTENADSVANPNRPSRLGPLANAVARSSTPGSAGASASSDVLSASEV